MSSFRPRTTHTALLADTKTPVGLYLKLRDVLPGCILLESADAHGSEHSVSILAGAPIAEFRVEKEEIYTRHPNNAETRTPVTARRQVIDALTEFRDSFQADPQPYNFPTDGLFGYIAYDAVRYFEDIDIKGFPEGAPRIPDILYHSYGIVIVVEHLRDTVHVFEHRYEGQPERLNQVLAAIQRLDTTAYRFKLNGGETSNFEDGAFMEVIQKAKDHCQRGDVFQIVPSRRFQQGYQGDEFQVYRALRSINPSPYLFFFDYGSFKIMGSSPEAQLIIKGNEAEIHPIAGTYKRTGNDGEDAAAAQALCDDPKENAEHVMLVDLARNDLSRHGDQTYVDVYKEIQFFSHVIHLVSKVKTTLPKDAPWMQLVADTFPAGTLSGAPKHMAMQLIERYERGNRGFYGGALGYLSFDGHFNHAIMIRTMLAQANKLTYQAGMGVVARSDIQSEQQEVANKLGALRKAIQTAQTLG